MLNFGFDKQVIQIRVSVPGTPVEKGQANWWGL
jgi:hypothetical protein